MVIPLRALKNKPPFWASQQNQLLTINRIDFYTTSFSASRCSSRITAAMHVPLLGGRLLIGRCQEAVIARSTYKSSTTRWRYHALDPTSGLFDGMTTAIRFRSTYNQSHRRSSALLARESFHFRDSIGRMINNVLYTDNKLNERTETSLYTHLLMLLQTTFHCQSDHNIYIQRWAWKIIILQA